MSAAEHPLPAPRPLRSLATAASGLLLVLLDVRIQGVDLVPDPLGWGLAAVAFYALRRTHRLFHVSALVAAPAAVVSVPDCAGLVSPLLDLVLGVAVLAVQVMVCSAIIGVSATRARVARTIRAWVVGLAPALAVALVVAGSDSSLGILVLVVGSANLVVAVCFVVLMYRVAKEPSTHAGLGMPGS